MCHAELVQHLGDTPARDQQLFLSTRDLVDPLLCDLGAARLALDEIREIVVHLREQRDVVTEIAQDATHRRLDPAVQRFGRAIAVIDPPHCGTRQRVKEPPRRVLFAAEEGAVDDRDLEHRNLQSAQQGLHRVGHVVIVEDEVEQHTDDIDQVLIDLIEALGRGLGRPHL